MTSAVIGTVSAHDPDASQTLSYAITAGNASGAFQISAGGVLSVKDATRLSKVPAGQTTLTVPLTIKVTDSDANPLNASATMNVVLNTTAGMAPKVAAPASPINVAENNAAKVKVVKIVPTAVYTGQKFDFALTGADAAKFAIDATGQITVPVANSLNFEAAKNSYTFQVKVFDHADNSKSTTIDVPVNVTNVNEAPAISAQSFTIDEYTSLSTFSSGTHNGSVVGTVVASDPDAGQTLNYAITAGNGKPESPIFAIDATGQITVVDATRLSYEVVKDKPFALTVTVTDNASPAKSSKATVSIHIHDINDPSIITGAKTSTINDNKSVKPFSAVKFTDADTPLAPNSLTATITLDDKTKGTLTLASLSASNLGSNPTGVVWSTSDGGLTYTATGLAADLTAAKLTKAIQALVFVPTKDHVAVGTTETTHFIITVNDGSAITTDSASTVDSLSINDAPTITGAVAGIFTGANANANNITDKDTVHPFASITIGDTDVIDGTGTGQQLNATITLDKTINGNFTAGSLSSLVGSTTITWSTTDSGKTYTATGTATQLTAAIRALIFDPIENLVAVGKRVSTKFTISVKDAFVAKSTISSVSTVVVNSANDAPSGASVTVQSTIHGTLAVGKQVATLAGIDPDLADKFTFALVSGDGTNDHDNDKFSIGAGSKSKQLLVGAAPVAPGTYKIFVRVSDLNGAMKDVALTFTTPT